MYSSEVQLPVRVIIGEVGQNVQGILLAEDNPADVFLVRMALQAEGILNELNVLSDGEAVLKLLARLDSGEEDLSCPELVILDLNLPRYSGDEILTRLRKSPRCGSAPIVVVTSSDSPKDREHAAKHGVAEYFRKPADFDQFMRLGKVVKRVLESKA